MGCPFCQQTEHLLFWALKGHGNGPNFVGRKIIPKSSLLVKKINKKSILKFPGAVTFILAFIAVSEA